MTIIMIIKISFIINMQISTSVRQITEVAALKLSALTAWAVISVRVNQDTPEMDKLAWVSLHEHACTYTVCTL